MSFQFRCRKHQLIRGGKNTVPLSTCHLKCNYSHARMVSQTIITLTLPLVTIKGKFEPRISNLNTIKLNRSKRRLLVGVVLGLGTLDSRPTLTFTQNLTLKVAQVIFPHHAPTFLIVIITFLTRTSFAHPKY